MFTVHSLIPFVSRRGLRRGVPAVCAALLAAGCTSESLDGGGAGGSASGPEAWMTLSLAMPQQAAVRAGTPAGGEQGDGAEAGQQAENVISRAVAFFYKGKDGANSPAETPILDIADFPFTDGSGTDGTEPDVDSTYTTQPQSVSLEPGTYQVLLIANPGADWWSAPQGGSLTLGTVRDHIQSSAWTEPQKGTFANFVMTSERDATVALNNNPRENPATAIVYVERMAARVDYKAQGFYTCTDEPYKGDTVSIVGAALVNNLTAGSYVLKRVSPDATASSVSYLGQETADATTGAGTNYVIDPYTTHKSNPAAVKQYYDTWYADKATPDVDPAFWSGLTRPGTALEGADNAGYLRIGYTLENTAAPADSAGRTGIVFRAQFAPKGVTGYTLGQTFFTYGGVIYASVERLMTAVYGTASPVEKTFAATDTWQTVRNYAADTLLPSDPSGYPEWLTAQAADQDPNAALTADEAARLGWKAYMRAECGYENKPEAGGADRVAINQGGVNTRAALRSGGVRTYADGQCYYTYWLRHAADGDATKASPMEYAVVRNNVYKVDVTSIYSLGGDVPGEDDHNLVIEVYVNDWRLLPTEALPM